MQLLLKSLLGIKMKTAIAFLMMFAATSASAYQFGDAGMGQPFNDQALYAAVNQPDGATSRFIVVPLEIRGRVTDVINKMTTTKIVDGNTCTAGQIATETTPCLSTFREVPAYKYEVMISGSNIVDANGVKLDGTRLLSHHIGMNPPKVGQIVKMHLKVLVYSGEVEDAR